MTRRAHPTAALLLALLAAGCSTYDYKDLEITSEHDRSLDFYQFKTWDWAPQPTPKISDPRVHELTAHTRFKRNFASEVLRCGLSPSGGSRPDILVRYEIWLVASDRDVPTSPGKAESDEAESGEAESRTHDRAGVRIDMLNGANTKVLWTATAIATVDFRAPLDERDLRVRRAVRRMLQRYPLYEAR